MANILVVDPDAKAATILGQHLSRAGHEVLAVASAEEALSSARGRGFDLVLADLVLPRMSGTELCRTLKADAELRSTAVILFGESSDEIDRVVAFEVGADDYVTKPLRIRELVLRVRAILRRRHRDERLTAFSRVGALELDPSAPSVSVDGSQVDLSLLELTLLVTLFERRGRVQTRESLLDQVWERGGGVSLRTVDACVKRLRKRLGVAGKLIQTVRGVGYRFAPDEDAS